MSNEQVETIAGVLAGKGRNQVVAINKDTGETRTVDVRGRMVYVRKCLKPEEIKGIIIPKSSRENSTVALVLAVGDKCGLREEPTPLKRKTRNWKAQCETQWLEPGRTQVLLPDDSEWGYIRSPYGENEAFVNECLLLAVLDTESETANGEPNRQLNGAGAAQGGCTAA